MAKNVLPIILIGGAAFFMLSKRGNGSATSDEDTDSDVLGDGDSGEGETEEVADETAGFDTSSPAPRIETIEDYEAWKSVLQSKNTPWVGTIEFIDMDADTETIGMFIESELGKHPEVYARTVDRGDLDPDAAAAMLSDSELIQKSITDAFDSTAGLETVALLMKPQANPIVNIYFLFDSEMSQQQALPKVGVLMATLGTLGYTAVMRYGYMGMSAPPVESSIKAFLAETFPQQVSLQGIGV